MAQPIVRSIPCSFSVPIAGLIPPQPIMTPHHNMLNFQHIDSILNSRQAYLRSVCTTHTFAILRWDNQDIRPGKESTYWSRREHGIPAQPNPKVFLAFALPLDNVRKNQGLLWYLSTAHLYFYLKSSSKSYYDIILLSANFFRYHGIYICVKVDRS